MSVWWELRWPVRETHSHVPYVPDVQTVWRHGGSVGDQRCCTDRLTYVYHFTAVLVPHWRDAAVLMNGGSRLIGWFTRQAETEPISRPPPPPPPPNNFSWDVFSHRVLCGIPNYHLSFQPILFLNFLNDFFYISNSMIRRHFFCFS